jgi:scyllo-inositol 2-dehydrogenase (NADP+)
MQPIRTALVSFGISSRTFHAPFLTTMPEYQLLSVVERSGDTSKEKYPFVTVERSIEDLLKNDEIELVVITSPNETHFPYAKMAMEAGKHVVLEKPFANTSAEAMDLVNVAKATGKICAVYHNRRYVADYLTMKQIIEKKMLGELHEFEAHYDRYRPDPRTYGLWREKPLPGSGVFYDLGSHLLDQSLQLFGHPQYIIADIRKQKPYSVVDDYFDVRLDYGFLKVLVKSGMLVREMGPRYMMHGTKGSFIKYGEDTQEELLKAGELPVGPDWGKEPESQFGLIHTEIDGKLIREVYPSVQGGFGGFYQNLSKTIRENAPLKEKPEHGYNVIRLIELAFESNEKQCRVKVNGLLDT